jgi:peptidyl-tRNA hydrolase, PTH1 family
VERLASEEGIKLRSRESLSRVGRGTVEGKRVLLALPQTLMNASGEAVTALCKSNGIDPSDLCIVFDDVALPLGTLRLRARGSAGGQKGMASILSCLGTTEIPRLRVGVRGERYSRQRNLADYVLEPFAKEERDVFAGSVDRAVEALRIWLSDGIDAAMKRANIKLSSPDPAQGVSGDRKVPR